jgi:NAD(P)-dependent dehydrogenase (short-subunit alcohol dehydrogenase family)/acyl carrier protein
VWIDVAAHSPMVEPILAEFGAFVRRLPLESPQIPYLSNVTGTWIEPRQAVDPDYWVDHLRRTVRFAEGMTELLRNADRVFLEIGPGQTLSTFARLCPRPEGPPTVLPSLRRPQDTAADHEILLGTLGRLWSAGFAVDWSGVHAGERRRRLPLPTYPFERARFWVEPGRGIAATVSGRKDDVADWFYVPHWKPAAPPRALEVESPGALWLIFLDGCGVGQALATRVEREGVDVVTVARGERFERPGARAFVIAPHCSEDYGKLFAALEEAGALPDVIAHLFSLTGPVPEAADGFLDRCQDLGFFSAVYLAQALGNRASTLSVRIGFVSDHLQQVADGEMVHAAKATLLGPCRVIPQEYPNLSCRSIDLDRVSAGEVTAAADHLFRELAANAPEPVIAHRGGRRYAQCFTPVHLGAPPQGPALLREQGVYLITGGLGGIGLALAEHLARAVQARLVLLGRSPSPERAEWERHLAEGSPDLSSKIRRLKVLEELGAKVVIEQADVSDRRQMRQVIARVRERCGALHGVIHAAGVAGAGMTQVVTREHAERVLAPKLSGTVVLEEILAGAELDFLVLCSSLTTILGGFGQVAYCGANAFLDAAAGRAAASGRLTLSLAWDMWRDVGMALTTDLPGGLEERRLAEIRGGMSTGEGIEVFRRALWSGMPRLAVSVEDLSSRLERYHPAVLARSLEGHGQERSSWSVQERPHLTSAYVAPESELERRIAAVFGELLGIEQVGLHDDFFEMGGHSLLATQVVSRLRDAFHVELRLKEFFAAPTVGEVAGLIAQKQVAGMDEQTLAELLVQIRGLSDEDAREILASGLREESGAEL